MYKDYLKPAGDFLIALLALIIISPVFFIVFVCLSVANSGKPFFFQARPGKSGRIFSIIKFKTMNDKRSDDGKLLPDALRMTKIGTIVRKTSLDEIPQLFNVLMGQMSLVGPRPLLAQYIPLYNEHQLKRHDVRPGITGWAQVNGRNAISWQQKFAFDVWYVENVSMSLDFKILYLTFIKVIKRDGISAAGQATMEAFKGNEE